VGHSVALVAPSSGARAAHGAAVAVEIMKIDCPCCHSTVLYAVPCAAVLVGSTETLARFGPGEPGKHQPGQQTVGRRWRIARGRTRAR
jgi:hypothetical protein